MRVAFLGTRGDLTLMPLRAVAADHEVVLLARSIPPRRHGRESGKRWRGALRSAARALGLKKPDPVSAWAASQRVELLDTHGRDDPRLLERLSALRPELICISTYRWILGDELLSSAERGAVNLHTALLPRHRGPNPFFWLYHAGDLEAGVTVHWIEPGAGADTGPILGQESFALPRGRNVASTGARCAELGAKLLARTLARLEHEDDPGVPQDESRATLAPPFDARQKAIDYEVWGVDRAYHFLAGLVPRFVEPLEDEEGRRVDYRTVPGFTHGTPVGPPGSVVRSGKEWLLSLRDGSVCLSTVPRRKR